ncbi:MAG: SH3 domain-containing protein [Chloroflexi bacterium]|nr:SH3 domain-containing protein [Chloroflexota bacterium]
MKVKCVTSILVMLFIYSAASAQSYAIRVTYNTNLRTANSLASGVVDTAPAGSILQVLGQQGRWLQINWNGNQVWMAGWVGHSRVQSAPQAASSPQVQAQTQIDNCCFVDRQCNSDQDWTDGYYAYQNGQCAAPVQPQPYFQPQPQPQPYTQPQTWVPTQQGNPHEIDNCCHLDRECHSEEEWRAGYVAFKELECWDQYHAWARTPDPRYMPASGSDNCCTAQGWLCLNDEHSYFGREAFRNYGHCNPRIRPTYLPNTRYYEATNNCCHLGRECHSQADWDRGFSDFLHFRCEFSVPLIDHIPVQVVGSPDFLRHTRVMFSLLKAKSPYYYDYAARGMDKHVQKSPAGASTHNPSCGGENIHLSALPDAIEDINWWREMLHEASILVHEACHCIRHHSGQDQQLLAEAGRHTLDPDFMDGNSVVEVPCMEQQFHAIRQMDPADSATFAKSYALGITLWVRRYPWLERYLERPVSHYQHYLDVGP